MNDQQFADWAQARPWFDVLDAAERRIGRYESDGAWHEYIVRADGTVAAVAAAAA